MRYSNHLKTVLAVASGILLTAGVARVQAPGSGAAQVQTFWDRSTGGVPGPSQQLQDAVDLLRSFSDLRHSTMPATVLLRARAIVVFPSIAQTGAEWTEPAYGVMSVRDPYQTSLWSAPAFVKIPQGMSADGIGPRGTGLLLLVMNRSAVTDLIREDSPGRLSIRPGPLGPGVESAGEQSGESADVFAYSLSGTSLAGMDLRDIRLMADLDANQRFYGAGLSTDEIVHDRTRQYRRGQSANRHDIPEHRGQHCRLRHEARMELASGTPAGTPAMRTTPPVIGSRVPAVPHAPQE